MGDASRFIDASESRTITAKEAAVLDEKTYADALTRRADMLYHIAKTILVSDDDCRDALQDAALRGWEKRWQLRDAQLFDAWITRILINCCHAIG